MGLEGAAYNGSANAPTSSGASQTLCTVNRSQVANSLPSASAPPLAGPITGVLMQPIDVPESGSSIIGRAVKATIKILTWPWESFCISREVHRIGPIINALATQSKPGAPNSAEPPTFGRITSIRTFEAIDRVLGSTNVNPCTVFAALKDRKSTSALQILYAFNKIERLSDQDIKTADLPSLRAICDLSLSMQSVRGDRIATRILDLLPVDKRNELFHSLLKNSSYRRLSAWAGQRLDSAICQSPNEVLDQFDSGRLAGAMALAPGPLSPEFLKRLGNLPYEVLVNTHPSGVYRFTKGNTESVVSRPLSDGDTPREDLHNHPSRGYLFPSGLLVEKGLLEQSKLGGDLSSPTIIGRRFIASPTGLTVFEIDTAKQGGCPEGKGAVKLQTSDGCVHYITLPAEGIYGAQELLPFVDTPFTATGARSPTGTPIKVSYTPWDQLEYQPEIRDAIGAFCSSSNTAPISGGIPTPMSGANDDPIVFERLSRLAVMWANSLPDDVRSPVFEMVDYARQLGDEGTMAQVTLVLGSAVDPALVKELIPLILSYDRPPETREVLIKLLECLHECLGTEVAQNIALRCLSVLPPGGELNIVGFVCDARVAEDFRMEIFAAAAEIRGLERLTLMLIESGVLPERLVTSFLLEHTQDAKKLMLYQRKEPFFRVSSTPRIWDTLLKVPIDWSTRLNIIAEACRNLESHHLEGLIEGLREASRYDLPSGWKNYILNILIESEKFEIAELLRGVPVQQGASGILDNDMEPGLIGSFVLPAGSNASYQSVQVEIDSRTDEIKIAQQQLSDAGLAVGEPFSTIEILRLYSPSTVSNLGRRIIDDISAICRTVRSSNELNSTMQANS